MIFNSVHFLAFFSVVVAFYFSVPHRLRWPWLLLASCYFYMSFIPLYVLILFALILVDYGAAIAIEGAEGSRRKLFLIVSLVSNIGILGFFKYFDFVNENLAALLGALGAPWTVSALKIALPLGLSFHTFQSMSYTIEVYRGNRRAERHLGVYALFIMFFPQLVAGPIERPEFLDQLKTPQEFDDDRVLDGLRLMLWGFVKKVVVADRLAVLVDHVYRAPGAHGGAELALATWVFAVQIYCDFSGYSDIAVGAARVLGFELVRNFDHPYSATSLGEFWRRWHISLSSWFKDYLYDPIAVGLRRYGLRAVALGVVTTFFLCGLWHGANWTYVAWGLWHGGGLALEASTSAARRSWLKSLAPGLREFLGWFAMYNFVSFSYVFFRAASLGDSWLIIRRIFDVGAWTWPADLKLSGRELLIAALSVAALEGVQWLQRRDGPVLVRWERQRAAACAVMVLVIALLGRFESARFIYFQF